MGEDSVARPWLRPPVGLDLDALWGAIDRHVVHDVDRFAAAALLHHGALAVGLETRAPCC